MRAANTILSAATSRSASSRTIAAALPPSSKIPYSKPQSLIYTCFRCHPQISATLRPTRSDPVELIRRTGCMPMISSVRAGASCVENTRKLSTPLGISASINTSTTVRCVRGEYSEAFRITVFPQIKGTAIARKDNVVGAFHLAIASTTPTGSDHEPTLPSSLCKHIGNDIPGKSDGITSLICVTADATSLR
jgi:hypothetical protein